jgi:tetratricopeptide (TPR) repeat protein
MHRMIAMTFLIFGLNGITFSSQANEPHPGPRSSAQAEFLFHEAQKAYQKEQYPLAVEQYRKLIQTYPQFEKILDVYSELMSTHLKLQQAKEIITLGEEAIHLHPKGKTYSTIQFLRIHAELLLNRPLKAKLIADEIIRSRPDADSESAALLFKAEALSRLGKHLEARRSLDAGKSNELHSDVELKVRTRACLSRIPVKGEDFVAQIQQKNLCFKEAAALARTEPAKDASQVWCEAFHQFENGLEKAKVDSFTREKLKKELGETKGLTATWGCR